MLKKLHYPADTIDTSYVDDICMVQLSHTVSKATSAKNGKLKYIAFFTCET